ncbi:rod outer segment membrane protein 1 isoform X1 [Bufo bufo]|uniref:rod outer segment membrane protein 1 isoform X1 n=1 Tax=Bufo bufo TaxID=8384 RepID=UPI001ABDF03B|nr:rod outer segment membrane protein 1 isoform X1 [Bufo bufo]
MVLFKTKFTFQKRVKLAQTLWLLSWISVLIGSVTFGLGVFLKVQLWIHNEVMDNTVAHAVPNTVITAGLVGAILGLFAGKISQDSLDMGKYPRWKPFLLPYFFLTILSCSLCVAALFLSVFMTGSLEESLKIGLRNGIRFYKDTDTPGRCYQKRTIDKLQMDFQCCGNNHYKDWFEVQWISNRYLDFSSKEVKDRIKSNVDGRYLMDSVPFSCCNPNSPRPCIQMQITNNSAHYSYNYQTDELNIWVQGCREVLLCYYTGIMATNGAAVTLFFLIQGSVLVSMRLLQTSMDKITGVEDLETDSEGFLLEKGVGETINSGLEKTKALFKSSSGEAGGGEAAAS